jgi:hypothetical protein
MPKSHHEEHEGHEDHEEKQGKFICLSWEHKHRQDVEVTKPAIATSSSKLCSSMLDPSFQHPPHLLQFLLLPFFVAFVSFVLFVMGSSQ